MKKTKLEFERITQDILYHPEFIKLKGELHHGISRYEHSVRVAKTSYNLSKAMKLNYKEITRAALLHDFFFDEELKEYNKRKTLVEHPKKAKENAKRYFVLNERQENAIESHMFPLMGCIPKYKESIIVGIADKLVATHEMYRYKAVLQLGILMIFFFNMMAVFHHID